MLTFATVLKILLLIVCFALEWLERKRMFPVAPIFFEELNAYLLSLTVNQNPVYRLHELNRPLQKRERTGKEYGCFPFV